LRLLFILPTRFILYLYKLGSTAQSGAGAKTLSLICNFHRNQSRLQIQILKYSPGVSSLSIVAVIIVLLSGFMVPELLLNFNQLGMFEILNDCPLPLY
jgi:hypothetical protein